MALEKIRPSDLSAVPDADALSGDESMLIDNEDEVLRLPIRSVRIPARMTKAVRNALSSVTHGTIIYQTDNTPGLRVYENGAWVKYSATADP